jgi:hypothetical protein
VPAGPALLSTPAGPELLFPARASALFPRLGCRPRSPGWAAARSPGWAAAWSPGWAVARSPGWAETRSPGWASSASRPEPFPAPVGPVWFPGWAGMSSLAGPVSLLRAGASQAGIPRQAGIYLLRLGLFRCTVTAGPGRDSLAQAGLLLSRVDIYSSRSYFSSSINSSALCQSWDTSKLGLAYPPSLYTGLGTPLGSDQHIPPLLVSLILKRRIRLMT